MRQCFLFILMALVIVVVTLSSASAKGRIRVSAHEVDTDKEPTIERQIDPAVPRPDSRPPAPIPVVKESPSTSLISIAPHFNTVEPSVHTPWEQMTAIGTTALAILAAIAIVATIYTVNEATRTSNRQHRHQIALDSLKLLLEKLPDLASKSQLVERTRLLLDKRPSNALENILWNNRREEFEKQLRDFVTSLELIALAVNSSAIDIGYANALFGTFLEKTYNKYGWYIRLDRRMDFHSFRELEMMMDDLLIFRRALYGITGKVLLTLKRDAADPRAIRRLEGRDDLNESLPIQFCKDSSNWFRINFGGPKLLAGPSNRDDLLRHLHTKEIWEDKFLVCKHAFQRSFEIKEYDSECEEEKEAVRESLRVIYGATVGMYPPIANDTPAAINQYISGQKGVIRFLAFKGSAVGKGPRGSCVGHVSIVDLAQVIPKCPEESHLWLNILSAFGKSDARQYYIIQELCVKRGDEYTEPQNKGGGSAAHGLSRMLIRHAIRHVEEQEFPAERQRRHELRLPAQDRRLALVIVDHRGMQLVEHLYFADGVFRKKKRKDHFRDVTIGPQKKARIMLLEYGDNEYGVTRL